MVNLRRPAAGRVTQPFSSTHRALDFGWGKGRTVRAAAGGEISYDVDPYYGRCLTIWHSSTDATRYCHLASASVKSGRVEAGEAIAVMGNTGSYAIFVHLHFELWHEGVRIEPVFTTTASAGETLITTGETMPQLIKQTVRGVPTYYRVDIADVVLPISKDEAAAYNKVNDFDGAIEVSNAGLAGFRRQAAAVAAARTQAVVAALAGGIPVTAPPAVVDDKTIAAIASATSAKFPSVPSSSAIATAAADESDRRERQRLGL